MFSFKMNIIVNFTAMLKDIKHTIVIFVKYISLLNIFTNDTKINYTL